MNSTFKKWIESPAGALIAVATVIILGEFSIMAVINSVFAPLLGEKVSPWFWEFVDPLVLSVIVLPFLYYFVLRPMRQQILLIEKQSAKLVIAKGELAYQSSEKADRAAELVIANVELAHQTNEKANRAAELVIANKELVYQSGEKTNRAAELVIANEELVYQSDEKAKRAAEFQEVKEEAESVRELAFYDALTGLPNRRLLNDRLRQAILASKRSVCYSALLFLDLDNFKPLNDKHGHGVGDLLLIEVANRLKSCVREIDTVARFGGDEFVVLLSELNTDKADSKSHARIVSEKIQTALSEPYLLNLTHEGKADSIVEHHCTASIGVALFLNHEVSQNTILMRADSSMYKAKEAGRNQVQFYE